MLVISLTIIIMICEVVTSYYEIYNISFDGLYKLATIIGFGVSPVIPYILAITFKENISKKEIALYLLPLAINFILVIFSVKFGFIFKILENNTYARGSLFSVYMITYLIGIFMLLINTYTFSKYYYEAKFNTLILIFLFLIFGTTIQIFIPYIHTSWLCVTFSIAAYYSYFGELTEKQDPLTEVFNRRLYEDKLKVLEKSTDYTYIIFDIDDFKGVNDKYGHQYGDKCLSLIAKTIKETFLQTGICYRVGGDEFVVISTKECEKEANKSRDKLNKRLKIEKDKDNRIPGVTVGIASNNKKENRSLNSVILKADTNMYINKKKQKLEINTI